MPPYVCSKDTFLNHIHIIIYGFVVPDKFISAFRPEDLARQADLFGP